MVEHSPQILASEENATTTSTTLWERIKTNQIPIACSEQSCVRRVHLHLSGPRELREGSTGSLRAVIINALCSHCTNQALLHTLCSLGLHLLSLWLVLWKESVEVHTNQQLHLFSLVLIFLLMSFHCPPLCSSVVLPSFRFIPAVEPFVFLPPLPLCLSSTLCNLLFPVFHSDYSVL